MSDREHPLLIEYSGITALEEKSPPLWLLHPIVKNGMRPHLKEK